MLLTIVTGVPDGSTERVTGPEVCSRGIRRKVTSSPHPSCEQRVVQVVRPRGASPWTWWPFGQSPPTSSLTAFRMSKQYDAREQVQLPVSI